MKRVVAILLVFILCFSLCGCKKTENMKAAESAIKAIGTVTVDSGDLIKEAEKAVEALNEQEKSKFRMHDELEEAKEQYEKLVAEAKIAEVTEMISKLGEATLENSAEIDAAKSAYDELSSENREKITNADKLNKAVNTLKELRVAEKERIINEKTPLFNVNYDKMEGITWYEPKNMPRYIDIRSYIIPYIGNSGNNYWICIRYNYTADSWIFWNNMSILVDGVKYYKYVGRSNTVRDNDTEVWEYYDEALDSNLDMSNKDLKMLKAIAESEETIIRFQGDEYCYDLTVTAADKKMISDTLALYEAFLW